MSKKKLNSKFLEYGIDDSLFRNKQILGKYLTIIKNTKTLLNCNIITTVDNSNNNLGFNSLFNVVDKEEVIGITINIDLNKTLTVLFKFEEVWFDNQHIINYIIDNNEHMVIISEQMPSWGSKSVLKYRDLLKTHIENYIHNLTIKKINLSNTSFIKEESITIDKITIINNDIITDQCADEENIDERDDENIDDNYTDDENIDDHYTDDENIDDQYTDDENIDDQDLDINNNSIENLMKNIFETQQKMFNNQAAQTSLIIQLLSNMKKTE